MAQPEICKVPRFLELEYREEQKLNKVVIIENLIDKVVNYKVLCSLISRLNLIDLSCTW